MDEELPLEELLQTLDRCVGELLEDTGIEGPPVNALELVQRHLGLKVSAESSRKRGQVDIVLTAGMSEEARQWTAARAAGEHLRGWLKEELGTPITGSVARMFSERLLVPGCWFLGDARELDFDLLELKKRYHTAPLELIAFRLLDLPEPCIITIADQDRVQRRRSNGPPVKKQLAEPERACLEQVSKHGEPQVIRRGGWTVQGWPAPLDGWDRVILRSTVELE